MNKGSHRRSHIFDTETAVLCKQNEKHASGKAMKSSRPTGSRQRGAQTKGTSLQTLMLVFVLILLWMMLICFHFTVQDDVSMNESKSNFFVKRKPLKSYLDERLPAEDLKKTQAEESRRQTITSNIGSLPIELKLSAFALNQNHPSRRSLAVGGEATIIETPQQRQKQRPRATQAKPSDLPKMQRNPNKKIVTAYLESPFTLQEDVKPLPPRKTSKAVLKTQEFPEVHQCSSFLSDFGKHVVDNFPTSDPFLPYLHDMWPNDEGTQIHFVSQNRRNCQTGDGMYPTMKHWKPQIALFQPVPIVESDTGGNEPTFRLAESFDVATANETRFICRFHNSSDHSSITLSQFPFNYEFVTFRKDSKMLEEDSSKKSLTQSPFWVSQLLFSCPIPQEFQSLVRHQNHIVNDETKLWVDIVPIRTPARSNKVLLSEDMIGKNLWDKTSKDLFRLESEYGTNHTLPAISDSGRWANLPICQSPKTILKKSETMQNTTLTSHQSTQRTTPAKQKLVVCSWTSASYQRRGNQVTVHDSHARLREWILFHQSVGVDHIYLYDNSPISNATDFPDEPSHDLEHVTKEFPNDFVTYLRWPCKVCSNNRPTNKNPGDRSSQYAAESSCRERFGPSTEWMSFIDTDEYLAPMKEESWRKLLNEMESKGIQILKMRSSRGLPRHDLMRSLPSQNECEIPVKRSAAVRKLTQQSCQEPSPDETFLKVYNCDYIKPPRPSRFARAMKQIYRPDYVLSHFVHYSTVTADIARYQKDQPNSTDYDDLLDWKEVGADKEIFLDEVTQGSLIHARSVLPHETIYRSDMCQSSSKHKCPLGYVCPNSTNWVDDKVRPNSFNPFVDVIGNYCNCWVNEWVDRVLVPKLELLLAQHMPTAISKGSRLRK